MDTDVTEHGDESYKAFHARILSEPAFSICG